jgi:hypothetical protein
MTDISHFMHVWNGTEPGWAVLRRAEDREQLVVAFEGGANVRDLKALRALLPELGAAPASQLMALKGAPSYDLGEYESAAAHRLKARCALLQLSVSSIGRQVVHYGIFNELTRVYCLIEDDGVNKRVAAEAIRHGVQVRESIV